MQAGLLPASSEEVGIDVGLSTFAYLSTGEEIANPRFFRTEEAALASAQRKLAKAPKGSKERARKRKVVARIHERIANRRKTFIEQEVSKLIERFASFGLLQDQISQPLQALFAGNAGARSAFGLVGQIQIFERGHIAGD